MSGQAQHDSSPGLEDGAATDGAAAGGDGPAEAAGDAARGRMVTRFAGRTAVGQVREHNEDNLVIANLTTGQIRPRDEVCEDDVGERGMLFSVCDGMGGAAAGEVASQMAVDILVEAMRRGGPPKNRDALARRLVQAVEEAGRRIFQSAQKERSRRGMGTTTTVAVLIDKVLFLGEVGDSRGYLLRRGQLRLITKDQSLVNQLIEAGHLTEDEAEAFEHSNIILQALGTAESVNVDLTFVELRKGDRLMLCSDGLSGLVHAEALRATLDEVRDQVECCNKLIELAEAGGGHDNITCIVADFEGDQLAPPDEGESFGYMQYPLPLSDEDSTAFADEDTVGGQVRQSVDEDQSLLPTQRPASPEPMMRAGDDEGDDARANALWILAGALALIGALGVWWTLDPKARSEQVAPPPVVATQEAPTSLPAAEPLVEEVQVNVYTDVEAATLLVNGESQGELSSSQSKSLQLKPGAYRFEAQAGGSPRAVTVVTVRGDMPMDVFLKEPSNDAPDKDAKKAASDQEHEPGVPDEPESESEVSPVNPAGTAAEPSPAPRRAAREGAAVAGETKPAALEAKPAALEAKPAVAPQPTVEAKPIVPATAEPKPAEAPRPVRRKAADATSSGGATGTTPAPPTPDLPSNPF